MCVLLVLVGLVRSPDTTQDSARPAARVVVMRAAWRGRAEPVVDLQRLFGRPHGRPGSTSFSVISPPSGPRARPRRDGSVSWRHLSVPRNDRRSGEGLTLHAAMTGRAVPGNP